MQRSKPVTTGKQAQVSGVTPRTTEKRFQLEHLYHGYFVEAGRPVGAVQLLAHSPGVSVEQANACRRLAPLAPVGGDEAVGADSAALGLVSDGVGGFILAHIQRAWAADGVSNPPTAHYLLLPPAAAEALASNLKAASQRLEHKPPHLAALDASLPLHSLAAPPALSARERLAALTVLLDACRHNTRTVRSLLSAVVKGQPLAVVNCPLPLEGRLDFIQGVLTLLPPPARAHVSFATNVGKSAACPAGIKFLAKPEPAPDELVFDWSKAGLATKAGRDHLYSTFAVGQMQLDPLALFRQLDALSDATRHRLRAATHGGATSLADALADVSRRAVLDISLRDGQPLDREAVTTLLQKDPTLTGELRAAYAGYLLKLTLSLDEPATADALIPLMEENRSLAVELFRQLDAAAQSSQAGAAYHVLTRWLNRNPHMAEALPRAIGLVALAYEQEMVNADDGNAVARLLDELAQIPTALDARLCRQMLQHALPLARTHQNLARATLCLAAQHLEAADFDSLLADAALVAQLPPVVQAALPYLHPEKPFQPPAPGLLAGAARSLRHSCDAVLARFAEQAVMVDRHELVDAPVLEALLSLARSQRAPRFAQVLRHTVWALARSRAFVALPPAGHFLMAQILLALDQPADFAQLLLLLQFQVFGGQQRDAFRTMVYDLFQQTPLDVHQALRTLDSMVHANQPIDHAALARAHASVLVANHWDADSHPAVNYLLDALDERPDLVIALGYPFMVDLLRHTLTYKKRPTVMRVAAPLLAHLPESNAEAAPILRKVWPALATDAALREEAIALLRLYARRLPHEEAQRLVQTFAGPRLARERQALAACLAIRPIFDTRDFSALAEAVKTATDLFSDLIIAFELNRPPGPKTLTRELDSLRGGLSQVEQRTLSEQALALAGHLERIGAPRARADEGALIANRVAPRSALEMLWWLGGFFSAGEPLQRALDARPPGAPVALPHPFGTRSAPILYEEIDLIANLLSDLLAAFPPAKPPKLALSALRAEVESRWKRVSLFEQRKLQDTLAQDCQTLARLIARIAETGGSRSFLGADVAEQVMAGKAPPRSVIDALRRVSGYYAGRPSTGQVRG